MEIWSVLIIFISLQYQISHPKNNTSIRTMERDFVPEEERERLFNEKMSHLTPNDLDRMREETRKEYDIRKHMGEVTEEADAHLLVVGTRYYQDTREDLNNFLQKARGTRLIIQPDPDCAEDRDAIAAYQVSDDRGFHKVGYIAKEMKSVAKEVIEQSGGRMAFVYVEGAKENHTSLSAWPIFKDKGVVKKIKRHVFRMPHPCGDIGAIWAFKATDTALELAKYLTGHCTPYEKLFVTNLFCRAAAANPRLFGPAVKYLTDDLRLTQGQNNYTIVQNMAVTSPMKLAADLAAPQEEAEDTDAEEEVSDIEGSEKSLACVKSAIGSAVQDAHFRGGKDWGLVRFALQNVNYRFDSTEKFAQMMKEMGFKNLPFRTTIERGFNPVCGSLSDLYFTDTSDTTECIRRTNLIKLIVGFYNKNKNK